MNMLPGVCSYSATVPSLDWESPTDDDIRFAARNVASPLSALEARCEASLG